MADLRKSIAERITVRTKPKNSTHISARESARISRENRRITDAIEKERNRKNVPEEQYLAKMKDPANVVEFDNLHTYFFTDIGTVKAVDGVSFSIPKGKTAIQSDRQLLPRRVALTLAQHRQLPSASPSEWQSFLRQNDVGFHAAG